MKKLVYRAWGIAMAICLVFSLAFSGAVLATEQSKAHNWYIKHNDLHTQPQIDAAQKMILRYDGYYIDKEHTDVSEDKVLYLTFDAGYENGNVEKILNVLKEENVPAAFFVLKNIVKKHGDLVRRMEQEGHTVCNHTMTHRDTTTMTQKEFEAELNGLATLYQECTGKEMPKYYRPPEGRYSEQSLRYAKEMGYKTIFWSIAYVDWDNDHQPDPSVATNTLLSRTHNGAVILLHPNSATNAAILQDLIKEWKAMGYRFGTLDELTAENA